MDDKTYGRMTWGCQCGHVSRSAIEEARHRHNFPLYCRRKPEQCIAEVQRGPRKGRRCRRYCKPGNMFCKGHGG